MRREISRRTFLRTALGAAALASGGLALACGSDPAPKQASVPPPAARQGSSIALSQMSPSVSAAYQYVAANRALAEHVPCYCSCGQSIGHESLWDCFMQESGQLEAHGSNCDICLDIARDVEAFSKQGLDLATIRTRIDEKYRKFGPPTKTS